MPSHAVLFARSAAVHVKASQSGLHVICILCVDTMGVGRMLTELAGTHVLKHAVCFHFIVTWRADGRVTCGK